MGLLYTSRWAIQPPIALKALGVMASITVFVYALNDTMDADLDRLSSIKSKRPIPSGMMTKRQGLLLSAVGGIIGFILSLTINLWTMVFALIFMGLGFSYSVPPIRLKSRFLMKDATLTTGLIISLLIGTAAVGKISSSIFLPILTFALGGMTIYPTFYDTLDIQEDKIGGCKTIAMILNQKRRLELSTFGLLTIMVTVTLTYGYFGLNIICPILTVFGCLLFLKYIFPLLMKPDEAYEKEILSKSISINRVIMLLIPLGFILGSLNL